MPDVVEHLRHATPWGAFCFFLAANAAIFVSSVGLCAGLGWAFSRKKIFSSWEPLRAIEMTAALGSVILNAMVSLLGWWLWQSGAIVIHKGSVGEAVFHTACMTVAMDFGMYVFHRVAHHPFVYQVVHRFHHRHEKTNPLSLFVLHPLEVLGFGGLMVAYLALVPTEQDGLLAYLTLNVLWGTLGHSGVEPLPAWILRTPVLRLIGTSTFHAGHHELQTCNYGFYTLIWDRLFGTLDPNYGKKPDNSPNPGH